MERPGALVKTAVEPRCEGGMITMPVVRPWPPATDMAGGWWLGACGMQREGGGHSFLALQGASW